MKPTEAQTVSVRPVAGVDVVKIRGKLALGEPTIHDIRSRLAELVEHRRYNWLLDMEGVTFLDSSGVGILVQAMTSSRNRQGDCRLAMLQERPRKVLKLVSLLGLFQVFDDVDSGVQSFSSKR
jgi:anti-sigma B factor antagonist